MAHQPMTSTPTKIREITDSIWAFSRPFLRVNLFKIGGRATAVRLSNGDVFLVSPTAPDDATKAALDKIGKVKYLAAPDVEHHLFIKPYKEIYPDAEIIAMEGLPEIKDGLKVDHLFTEKDKHKTFGPQGEVQTFSICIVLTID